MKCACQKPPAACAITPGGSLSHIKKTMHFYPGDFDAFWRRRWHNADSIRSSSMTTFVLICASHVYPPALLYTWSGGLEKFLSSAPGAQRKRA
jgi:hypothetical protein